MLGASTCVLVLKSALVSLIYKLKVACSILGYVYIANVEVLEAP